LITAGPTYEPIDPVRFIGNHSSGKMGYAIADAFAAEGAEVHLVSGPVAIKTGHPDVIVYRADTAEAMYAACSGLIENMDIAVFCAAVADFTPVVKEQSKVKRGDSDWNIVLKPTRDIAGEMGKRKKNAQTFIGFALETDDELASAVKKLERKNLDFIVLNSLRDEGAGFGTDTNRVKIVDKSGTIDTFDLKSKQEVAKDILVKILKITGHA